MANIVKPSEDISPDFKPNGYDAYVASEIIKYEGTPYAIVRFTQLCLGLSDNAFWFFLSTLWVSYSGRSDLNLWRKHFRNGRPKRKTSLMKPSELTEFYKLPDVITAYRAHRPGETDWISYTLNREIAERFAHERGVKIIARYQLRKQDVLALFLRRGEQEIIMLDPRRAGSPTYINIEERN